MRIIIVRHGKAEARSGSGKDRDRALVERGERQARWLGARLAGSKPRPKLILSSPYERAITTAHLIREAIALPLETAEELEVDEPLSGVIALIERYRSDDPLVLVGHNPQLSALVSLLCEGAGPREIELKTGQAAVVEVGEQLIGGGELVEMIRLDDEP